MTDIHRQPQHTTSEANLPLLSRRDLLIRASALVVLATLLLAACSSGASGVIAPTVALTSVPTAHLAVVTAQPTVDVVASPSLSVLGNIAPTEATEAASPTVLNLPEPAGAPGAPGIATRQAETLQVAIVEPAFKPPETWTYEPKVITVTVGARITWTNKGAVLHTVTSGGSKLFDSGDMAAGATFSYAPTVPGTISYVCVYHPWMKGTIIVVK